MFRKVVWATDGSEAADGAMTVAKMLAMEGGGELLVMHGDVAIAPGRAGVRYPHFTDESELRTKIEGQVAELVREGVSATLEVVAADVGGAAHALADAARAEDADLIVVGTRGHTPLGGLLVGSVTQRLLHIAPCPVLVVPGSRQETD